MVSISELAAFIAGFSTFVYKTVYFVLEVSYFIGQTLVNQICGLGNYTLRFLDSSKEILQVVYEDSSLFILDAGEKCSFVLNIITSSVTAIISGIFTGIWNIGYSVITFSEILPNFCRNIFSVLTNTAYNIFSVVTNGIVLFQNALILIKESILNLGSCVWLCIESIPIVITNSLNALFADVINLITNAKVLCFNFVLTIKLTIVECLYNMFNFFFNVPLNSAYGLAVILILLTLIVLKYKQICSIALRTSRKMCYYLTSFSNSLWTGKFLQGKRCKPKSEENVNNYAPVMPPQDLCIVCQENPKKILILPCKHVCLCLECAASVRKVFKVCPICRTGIKRTMSVYV